MAAATLPLPPEDQVSRWALFAKGAEGTGRNEIDDGRFAALFRDSAIGDVVPRIFGGPKTEYEKVFEREDLGKGAKAAYVAGRLSHDLISDGTRVPYWFLNHPLAITSLASGIASGAAGLAPNYREEKKKLPPGAASGGNAREMIELAVANRLGFRYGDHPDATGRGIPAGIARGAIPLATSLALIQSSGNHDLLNIAQGGRTQGYEAVLPSEGDPRQTTNPALESLLRYIVGRTGRLLPWEQFSEERPDVAPSDYASAKAEQFDKGLLGIGLLKGTGRNLEGEPEATLMGFRVPLSAAGAVAGSIGGAIGGSHLANDMIKKALDARREEQLSAADAHPLSLKAEGNRRLLGALIGSALGAVTGNLATKAVNSAVIQPAFYPERVAAADLWRAQQRGEAVAPAPLTPMPIAA
jgi:hypothetical protein